MSSTTQQSLGALMGNTQFQRTEARKKFLHTFFTDAIETAVNTWACVKEYHYQTCIPVDDIKDDIDNFYAVLTPKGDYNTWGFWEDAKEDKQPLTVNIDTIELGLMRYWEYCMGERDMLGYPEGHKECNPEQLGKQAINQDSYWFQLLVADLTNGADGDYDSITQSAVIELALFDQLMYA